MDKPVQFRSALGGFNREDVVHYLEYINNRHAAEVAQLNGELTALRSKPQEPADDGQLEQLRADLAEAEETLAELRSRLAFEQERSAALEQNSASGRDSEELKRQLDQAKAENQLLRDRAESAAQQDLDMAQNRERLARLAAENEELRRKNSALEAKLQDMETAASARERSLSMDSELEVYRRAERVERIARERAYDITARLKSGINQASAGPIAEAGGLTAVVERVAVELEVLCDAADKLQNAYRTAAESADELDRELRK